ncbi:MAG: hypothetical protein IT365_13650 [Candidatus Hydrogenedentes bacterium]|nr:hypothetical protein [Candidatus Hydrogenedentota bacterium]
MSTFLSGLTSAFDAVIQTTLQATVLAALILILQRLLRKRLTPRWHYALWLLVLARLFLPWTPESPTSLFNYVRTEQASTTQLLLAIPDIEYMSFDGPPEVSAMPPLPDRAVEITDSTPAIGLSWNDGLRLGWLGVAAILFLYVCAVNGSLWWRVRREPAIDDGPAAFEFASCKEVMGVRDAIRLVRTSRVSTPALLGLLRPRLLLPESMERALSREELRHVFLHELAHYRRGDLLVNWLMVACNIVHWFNPALWYAFHRMRADRELACDALAMSYIAPEDTSSYGRTLLRLLEHVARPRPLPGLVGVLERKSHLKKRIRGIAGFKPGSYRWSVLAVVLIAVLSAVALTNASSKEAAEGMPASSLAPDDNAPEPLVSTIGVVETDSQDKSPTQLSDLGALLTEDQTRIEPIGDPSSHEPFDPSGQGENVATVNSDAASTHTGELDALVENTGYRNETAEDAHDAKPESEAALPYPPVQIDFGEGNTLTADSARLDMATLELELVGTIFLDKHSGSDLRVSKGTASLTLDGPQKGALRDIKGEDVEMLEDLSPVTPDETKVLKSRDESEPHGVYIRHGDATFIADTMLLDMESSEIKLAGHIQFSSDTVREGRAGEVRLNFLTGKTEMAGLVAESIEREGSREPRQASPGALYTLSESERIREGLPKPQINVLVPPSDQNPRGYALINSEKVYVGDRIPETGDAPTQANSKEIVLKDVDLDGIIVERDGRGYRVGTQGSVWRLLPKDNGAEHTSVSAKEGDSAAASPKDLTGAGETIGTDQELFTIEFQSFRLSRKDLDSVIEDWVELPEIERLYGESRVFSVPSSLVRPVEAVTGATRLGGQICCVPCGALEKYGVTISDGEPGFAWDLTIPRRHASDNEHPSAPIQIRNPMESFMRNIEQKCTDYGEAETAITLPGIETGPGGRMLLEVLWRTKDLEFGDTKYHGVFAKFPVRFGEWTAITFPKTRMQHYLVFARVTEGRAGFDAAAAVASSMKNASERSAESPALPSPDVTAKLDSPISLEFEGEHLTAITAFMASYLGLSIELDSKVIAPKGSTPAESAAYATNGIVPYVKLADVPFKDALKALLRPLGLAYEMRGNTVYISTPDRLSAQEAVDESQERPKVEDVKVSVTFPENTTLMEAAAKLVDAADVNIVVDRRAVHPEGGNGSDPTEWMVPPREIKGALLIDVLWEMLEPLGLTFAVQPGFIWISTPDRIATETFEVLETRRYPLELIRELNGNAASRAESLADIRRMVRVTEPDSLKTLSFARIIEEDGVLEVRSAPTHLDQLEQNLLLYESANSTQTAENAGAEAHEDAAAGTGDETSLEHHTASPVTSATIDSSLQQACNELLRELEGSIVVLNADSGAVLAMAGSAAAESNDILHPAYQEAYPPGSLFKVLLAIAALEEGIITEETTFGCSGKFYLPGVARPWRCWRLMYGGHGGVNVVDALAYNCDVFFYNVALKLGPEKIKEWSSRLGLGVPTGIDLPGEAVGLIPDPTWKKEAASAAGKTETWEKNWYPGETVNLGIGQGAVSTTMLQNTALMMSILNGGRRAQPFTQGDVLPTLSEPLVSEETLRIVQAGLRKCVERDKPPPTGTGKEARIEGFDILGKTGTAQVVQTLKAKHYSNEEDMPYEQRDHALFIAGVMDRSPRIAVGVFIKHGLHGSSTAAPIARAVIAEFYGGGT